MQGTTVNGYKFVSLIGRGGMAEVWKAENGLGVCFAIKVLNANLSQEPAIVERFKGEAKIMVALNHPNIRKVIDLVNLSDGRPCIIMEYLEGADLASRMKRGEKFSETQLRKWWNQMVDVLNYTHSQGVIHRDIKPSNIFINESGDVKLLDFGIARTGDGLGTRTGSNMGTLMYMSPEQVTDVSRVSKMSDVYSLAVTFVHLASGKPPYDSALTEYTIMDSIVKTPLDTSSLPEPWNGWLKQYLVKEPASRMQLMKITEGASQSEKTQVSSQPIKSQTIDNEDSKTRIEKSLELKISKGPTDFSEKGGQTTIDVVTNGDEPTISLPCDWIVAQEQLKNGIYKYHLKIYENFGNESRTVQVKIGINRNGAHKEESFTITQKGKKSKKWILPLAIVLLAAIGCFCFWYFGSTLELTSAGSTFSESSEKKYVKVYSNRTVNVSCSADWISASLLDDGTIEIKCEKNTGKERTGYVYVETTNGAKKDSVKIRQQGITPTLYASENEVNFGAESSEKNVTIESNTSWEIKTCTPGFTVSKNPNGITIRCSENQSSNSRSGYVIVSTNIGTNDVSVSIQITQEGIYVNLGLRSGTLWKNQNENGFYDYNAAVSTFGRKLPTKEQFEELVYSCKWKWTGNGYKVVGPSGASIFLPVAGYRNCGGGVHSVGILGFYWSSTPNSSRYAWTLDIDSGEVGMYNGLRCNGLSVRLVCK